MRPTLRQRRLGSALARLRDRAGIDIDTVAASMGWTRSDTSGRESGRTESSLADIERLSHLYDSTDDERGWLLDLAGRQRERCWWQPFGAAVPDTFLDYLELEETATDLHAWEIDLVPGLLQTPDYARAVIESWIPRPGPDLAEQRLRLRMARRERMGRLRLSVVVDEGALRRRVGGDRVWREQLASLTRLPETVTLRVLPFSGGAHASHSGSFSLLTAVGATGVDQAVLLDNVGGSLFLEDEPEVRRFQSAFEDLRAAALDPESSRDAILDILRANG
ncbi:XRE family transcriptional regulator [Actinoalloteichus sp. AHMU CJ021]|uniref:helix-turn-helix domain-containing protein n=1 Tax=Actinoalloteichus sp. AHMU CJ021 TaxID=2072503 RepID=UPI000CA079E4|nr:XRE family transcriptional regulator [Actinoalloteichus sp. AHMU CJ021]